MIVTPELQLMEMGRLVLQSGCEVEELLLELVAMRTTLVMVEGWRLLLQSVLEVEEWKLEILVVEKSLLQLTLGVELSWC